MKICYAYIVSHIWMSHVIPWKVRLVLGNRNSTVCVCVCVCACVCVCMCVPLVWEVSMLRIAPCVCVCACVCVSLVWEVSTLQIAPTMGWLPSVGSIKLQVSFAEYRLFYRALLQKRPIIFLILLTKAAAYRMTIVAWQKKNVSHVTDWMRFSCVSPI